jgi:hypothetical protein
MLSIIASVFIFSAFVEPFIASLFAPKMVSQDWSGYVAFSDSQNPQPLVTGISASWTVPEVAASRGDSYSAAWIGVGGYIGDETLIQVGTEQDSQNGAGAYSVWYELLHSSNSNVVTISTMNVSPGDEMTASINLIDSNLSIWTVEIADITNGHSFRHDFQYGSSRLSAEWIVERPTINGFISTLANFGKITFTNATVNMSTADQPIKSFPNTKIVMYNRQGDALVSVSPITNDGSTFTVTYLATATTTQSILTSAYASTRPSPQATIQPALTQKKQFNTLTYHRKNYSPC